MDWVIWWTVISFAWVTTDSYDRLDFLYGDDRTFSYWRFALIAPFDIILMTPMFVVFLIVMSIIGFIYLFFV